MGNSDEFRKKLGISAGLCLIGVAAFWPLLRCDFINFDDPSYVTNEPRISEGLSIENVVWAFSTPHPPENWQPLTTLSYLMDVQVFGPKAFGHHFANLAIHIANTVVLFLILSRLTGFIWRSAMVAGLFALHPMNVEPVAWISSRKDVLCAFFFLISIWFYSFYAGKASNPRSRRQIWFYYGLALIFFVAALMSKAIAVTLPFVLLLLDYWPFKRTKVSRTGLHGQIAAIWPLVRGKAPFFVLAGIFSWLSSSLLHRQGGTQIYGDLSLSNRVANGMVSYGRYLGKLVWPSQLSVFYPRPPTWPASYVIISLLVILGGTYLAIKCVHKRPWLFVGWFWFVGILLPLVGIFYQLGGHAIANRYTYIAYPGLFIAVTFAAAEVLSGHRYGKSLATAGSVCLLASFCALTRIEVSYWQNSETLFRRALAVDKDNAAAHNLLGSALLEQGRLREAEEHFAEALRIRPDFPYAEVNYAMTQAREGKSDEGIKLLSNLLQQHPHDQEACYNLGYLQQQKGDFAGAIKNYEEALRLKPADADALNNLAWIRAANTDPSYRNGEEAVRYAQRACALTRFRKPIMIGTLAAAYAEAGRFKEAVAAAQKAQEVAEESGQTEIAEKNRKLLELYQGGKAYHEVE